MHLCAELLGDDAAHDVDEVFAGFFEDEGVLGFRPGELEAGGERGNPDFANRSVGGNYKFCFLGLLENDFELAAFAFDVEAVFVAKREQSPFQIFEGDVGFSLEVFFVKHNSRVSELRFDGLGDFVVADQAGDALDDLAVAGDQHAGGIAEQAAELVRGGIVADDNGIVHLGLRAIDVKALFLDPGSDDTGALFVHGDAQNGEAPGGVFLLHFDEPGNLHTARFAPSGPEIDEDYFSSILREREILAVEIFQGDVGSGRGGGVGDANLQNTFARLARGAVGEISGGDDADHGDDRKQIFLQHSIL